MIALFSISVIMDFPHFIYTPGSELSKLSHQEHGRMAQWFLGFFNCLIISDGKANHRGLKNA